MTAKATINMLKQKNLAIFITSLVIAGLFVFSLFCYVVTKDTCRRTFIFPSAENGKYIIEYRNLTEKPHQGDINLYIEEILLGSTVERTKLLFTPGTKLLSCFERNHILYVNLSKDLLQMGDGVIEIREGTELLKKNIQQNFSRIDSVEIFIDGKSAFEK
ncbi:Sporulation and spore germination [Treponema bryantii]|uniref:Sporulation and spore germination n=1 Tax=Treponema bryantii TaxID=163 RepID=A0A1H9AGD4_9SPIR|nr:GerMN domain-containing protein [Treponema bryantii]SEP75719.1 Sporulation and spore germination [Treponema bryantii]